MKFLFVCPEMDRPFETDDFRIVGNRGVKDDRSGARFLDAKAELSSPCPFCGRMHVFHVSELACPFTSPDREEGQAIEKMSGKMTDFKNVRLTETVTGSG